MFRLPRYPHCCNPYAGWQSDSMCHRFYVGPIHVQLVNVKGFSYDYDLSFDAADSKLQTPLSSPQLEPNHKTYDKWKTNNNCPTKDCVYKPRRALRFDKKPCNEEPLDHTSDRDSPAIQEVGLT